LKISKEIRRIYLVLYFKTSNYLSTANYKGNKRVWQGVTKRCHLSWLTNSALIYCMSPNAGEGGCEVSANEHSCAHGAQINFGDPSPYLTYGVWERVFLLRYFILSLFNSRSGRAGSCLGTSNTSECRPGTPRREDRRWPGAAQREPRRERGPPAPSCGAPASAIGWRSKRTTFRRSFPFPR
jgi:hypothetical protein